VDLGEEGGDLLLVVPCRHSGSSLQRFSIQGRGFSASRLEFRGFTASRLHSGLRLERFAFCVQDVSVSVFQFLCFCAQCTVICSLSYPAAMQGRGFSACLFFFVCWCLCLVCFSFCVSVSVFQFQCSVHSLGFTNIHVVLSAKITASHKFAVVPRRTRDSGS
jgi:hypothetical protein